MVPSAFSRLYINGPKFISMVSKVSFGFVSKVSKVPFGCVLMVSSVHPLVLT